MQMYEAKIVALSAAANLAADEEPPAKGLVSAAISYCMGKIDKAALVRKCAKNPLYARLILLCDNDGAFDTEAFCAAHKALYEGKTQCGELRGEDLSLSGGSCAPPQILRGSLKTVFTKLNQMQSAPVVCKADFAAQLCCYIRELIILSPFAYGNGIVRRAFVRNFCHAHGFSLNYAAADKKDIAAAEAEAFAADASQPLFSLLVKCLNYLQEESSATQLPRSAPRTQLCSGRGDTRPAIRRRPSGSKAPQKSNAKDIAPHTDTEIELMRQVRELQKTVAELRARIDELTAAQITNDDNKATPAPKKTESDT